MSPDLEQRSVIVVDDEPGLAEMMALMLETAGYRVGTYNNPREALEALKTLQPDAIVTDLTMPGVSGIDLIREVKGMEKMQDVPVVLVTAAESDKLAIQAAGAAEVLEKPFDRDHLVSSVDRVVGNGH